MGSLETLIKASKMIETSLVTHYNAQGRGLHDKLSMVGHHLPSSIVKKIRYIATIRNKAVHDDNFELTDASDIKAMAELVVEYIENCNRPAPILSRVGQDTVFSLQSGRASISSPVQSPVYDAEYLNKYFAPNPTVKIDDDALFNVIGNVFKGGGIIIAVFILLVIISGIMSVERKPGNEISTSDKTKAINQKVRKGEAKKTRGSGRKPGTPPDVKDWSL